MATHKPISTISYNSRSFLLEKINELYEGHIIQNYLVIFHVGEEGDKDHAHVYLEPNCRVDPMDIREMFNEYEIGHSKPLTVRPFRPSKEEDWIMYAVHDPLYLRMHGDEIGGKIEYKWQEIICPSDFALEEAYIRAKIKCEHSTASLSQRLYKGENPLSLVLEGANPVTINSLVNLISKQSFTELAVELHKTQLMLDNLISYLEMRGIKVAFLENGSVVDCDNIKKGDGSFEI